MRLWLHMVVFNSSCIYDWVVKVPCKQATLHRKHAATKLDLLSLKPEQLWHSLLPWPHHKPGS